MKCTLSLHLRITLVCLVVSCLILFGLQETGSIVESKQLVDEILLSITGRSIPIKDLFRLGKLVRPFSGSSASSLGKPRPVLIKLMTAWDRRVVLYSKRKLKDFRLGHFLTGRSIT